MVHILVILRAHITPHIKKNKYKKKTIHNQTHIPHTHTYIKCEEEGEKEGEENKSN